MPSLVKAKRNDKSIGPVARTTNINGSQTMTVCLTGTIRSSIAAIPLVSLCSMVLSFVLAGCAGSMGTMHADPATAAVTSFDGSYRSTIRITSSGDEAKGTDWCVTPGQPIITVANGRFSYTVPHPNVPGTPAPTFQAALARDGSFVGQANDGMISGRVSGTHMQGSIDGAGCIYAFDANRI
jgi:hypothetical protein